MKVQADSGKLLIYPVCLGISCLFVFHLFVLGFFVVVLFFLLVDGSPVMFCYILEQWEPSNGFSRVMIDQWTAL